MSFRMDRRSVLTGLTALGLSGCEVPATDAPAPARPAPPAPAPAMRALDLSALERAHGGRLGVAIMTPAGDEVFAWRGGERFLYCSTFKLFLAAATLQRVSAGTERLDREIPVTEADLTPHAPVTGPAVGSALTVEQLCKGMVEVSDNPAANLLIRALGGLEAWKAWYPTIGDRVTRVDRLEPRLNVEDGERDTTTPLQATANIARLLTGPATDAGLSADARALLERWLKDSPTGEGRIRAGVPNGFQVAHKTGTSGAGHANDIGLIWPVSGPPMPLAIYYDAPEAPDDAARDRIIAAATAEALAAAEQGAAHD